MEYFPIATILLVVILFAIILFLLFSPRKPKRKTKSRYDKRGFDHNRIHRNGTKFDDYGYDFFGYDVNGYNEEGYNKLGKNNKGQYNRFFDTKACDEEGFYSPDEYPISITNHAHERMYERLGIRESQKRYAAALDAYRYGRSKRQIKKSSADLIEEIEQRHEDSVVLIHRNTIYIFSRDNVLKTVYKNDKIPLG